MTDDEIPSAAGRLRAAMRRRVAKTCPVCGTPFAGVAQRRSCSAACRVRAARGRTEQAMTEEWEHRDEAGSVTTERSPLQPAKPASNGPGAGARNGGPSAPRSKDQDPPLAPRGASESLDAYLERAGAYLASGNLPVPRGGGGPDADRFWWPRPMSGEQDDDDSVSLVREGREIRTAQLMRASGMDDELGIAPPAPRGEGEPLIAYLERVSAFLMGGKVFDDHAAKLVRQSRRERTLELERASGLIRDDR